VTARVDVVSLIAPVDALIREVAGSVITPRFRQLAEADIAEKSPGELVTVADREAEAALTTGLLALLPGSRVVGEEASAADPSHLEAMAQGLVWIVDPLDGTGNFAAGNAPFGTIVALADEGETVAGWIFDPLADRMSLGVRGAGARVSHGGGEFEAMQVPPAFPPMVASLATQFMPADLREAVTTAAAERFDLRPIPRCAVEHYWRLCTGENHVAMFQRTLPWDHAAGALLFTEAGGFARRWNGSDYRFHDGQLGLLAAASESLWQEAAALLLGGTNGADGSVHDLPVIGH
jgi:fructose-1,6-bisphosphatase/inositol monophosphatase family enzyme